MVLVSVRIFYLILLCLIVFTSNQKVEAQQLAFPTAEGFGRFATGGRGGAVCKVINLNSSGAGSFKACMEQSGARTIIFDTGGIIDFSASPITNIPANLTVACQTAPGDGVLLKGSIYFYDTANVIMRYCRIRPGDQAVQAHSLLPDDGIGVTVPDSKIFDHMSLGTSSDDITGGYNHSLTHDRNVTWQWSIFSESTRLGTEPAMGVNTGGHTHHRVSFLHNLFADYSKRAPLISGGNIQVINNVSHAINIDGESVYMYAQYGPALFNIVNNYFSPVSGLGAPGPRIWVGGGFNASYENLSNIYINGNAHATLRPNPAVGSDLSLINYHASPSTDIIRTKVQVSTLVPGHPTVASQTDALTARTLVLQDVGARIPHLDTVDTRAVNDVQNGTGRVCGVTVTEAFCSTFGTYAPGTPPTDTDGDGMPDAWETANSLNPNSAADGPTIAGDGYSNLEHYINDIELESIPLPDEGDLAFPVLLPYKVGSIPITGGYHYPRRIGMNQGLSVVPGPTQ